MFNKKSDNDYTSFDSADTSRPTAVLSPSVYANTADANYSIINEWLVMRGDLESEADILVKGKIYGNVKCKMLIVDTGALIEGGIEADEVVVRGATKGIMLTKKVRFEKTAEVDSEIHHQTFSAEEGAKIRGALKYSDDPHGSGTRNGGSIASKIVDLTH
jgi:cytoskeletal protein CcmA (bactofilin family)